MIDCITLKHVGPALSMKISFAPGLNILTGDNGLGKTFILDIAWRVLTRTWPGLPLLPQRGRNIQPSIEYARYDRPQPVKISYDFKIQRWTGDNKQDLQCNALVLYVRADGGVSVWDTAKNSFQQPSAAEYSQPEAYHFSPREILDGMAKGDKVQCNGIIRDWITWQYQKKDIFETFTRVLETLSPDTCEVIRPGEPVRISVEDARDIPSVILPYGTIPITHTSSGIQRTLSLAYLMVWTWNEHREASNLLNREPANRMVILFDEVEAHLHPKWQRTFMPALFEAVELLESALNVQVIASTHAPLVLASVETEFCEDRDKIISFELQNRTVCVNEIPWAMQGDVVNWLVSETFGLRQARSRVAHRKR